LGRPGTPTFEVRARRGHPDFLDLPWSQRLERWDSPRLVKMAHGVSRHIVRFVAYDERVYALKATEEAVARAEYDLLRSLAEVHLPVVEAVGVVTGRLDDAGDPLPAVLVTRYLDFSLPYRYLFGTPDGPDLRARLVDAGVVLLARLHLEGVFWGDCSLNNILFRRDAGALMAYLVDAETAEHRTTISDAMRHHDVDIAVHNIAGDLSDLVESGRIPPLDIAEVVAELEDRYHSLWDELTREEEFSLDDRLAIEGRIRRLEELGFDVEEITLAPVDEGRQVRMRPVLLEEGHHARQLQQLTGLAVQENQARRFLADIQSWHAHLTRSGGRPVPLAVAAARWLAEVYQPHVDLVPAELADRLEPAELFHELLEHRWFLSERAGRHVDTDEALADYLRVLATRPRERVVIGDADAGDEAL
jgi:hypothetical protein